MTQWLGLVVELGLQGNRQVSERGNLGGDIATIN